MPGKESVVQVWCCGDGDLTSAPKSGRGAFIPANLSMYVTSRLRVLSSHKNRLSLLHVNETHSRWCFSPMTKPRPSPSFYLHSPWFRLPIGVGLPSLDEFKSDPATDELAHFYYNSR